MRRTLHKWHRHRRSFVRILRVCLLTALVSFVSSCGISSVEVARVPSPDGKFDAVVVEQDGGATTSYWYDLRVVERGKKFTSGPNVAALYGAIRNESAYGINVSWAGPRAVTFEYWKSRDTTLRVSKVNLSGQEIAINLKSGVLDPSAPPGGMAYNLAKR